MHYEKYMQINKGTAQLVKTLFSALAVFIDFHPRGKTLSPAAAQPAPSDVKFWEKQFS